MTELTVALGLSGINSLALLGFVFQAGKLVNRLETVEKNYARFAGAADSVITLIAKVETLEDRFTTLHESIHKLRNDLTVHFLNKRE